MATGTAEGSTGTSTGSEHGGEKPNEEDQPTYRNGTPDRLRLCFTNGESVVFGPLEERKVAQKGLPPLGKLVLQNILMLTQPREERRYDSVLSTAFTSVLFGLFVVPAITGRLGVPAWTGFVAVSLGLVVFLVVGFLVLRRGSTAVARGAAQIMMLFFVVAIGVVLPFGTALRFSQEDLFGDRGLPELTRLLQVVFVSVACMVPGLLFFLFDRQRLSTLRSRFEQQIFRLDPTVTTLADVQARYGKQINETYGEHASDQDNRLARHGRWPIPVATATLAVGWIVVFLPVGSLGPVDSPDDVAQHFQPHQSAVTFAFFGAYFFAINLVLRRYAQDDLRPKAYSTITVRVLIAMTLGWMIDATTIVPAPARLVGAFLVGVVPETFLTVVNEFYRTRLIRLLTWRIEESVPLQDLEGLDLYDRARLLDEGVANIEALAHHNIVDLMLETRIPAARLVDWVDQAILYLHTAALHDSTPRRARKDESTADPTPLRTALRSLGVRTATDLETAFRDRQAATVCALARASKTSPKESTQALEVLLASMRDDEWMEQIRFWRRGDPTVERVVHVSEDGTVRIEPHPHAPLHDPGAPCSRRHDRRLRPSTGRARDLQPHSGRAHPR